MRFANYNDNWNKSQLKNLCIFLKGNGVSKDELSKEGQPCILYGELYTTYKTSKIKEIKSRTMLDNPNLVRSKKNDVIIPCSGETAIDIATSVCVPVDNVILGGDLTIIRSNLDGEFLSNQINSVKRKAIATIAQGASIVHLHADDLKNIEIDFPTLAEQRKIADFIGVLDDRIEAQSKIIENLKYYKKIISDNFLYSKDTISYKPLKEFGKLKNGYAFKSENYVENGLYNIITIANVSGDRYIQTKECNKIKDLPNDIQKHQVLQENDILISLTGNVGRVSLATNGQHLLNQRVGLFELFDKNLTEYIYQCLSNKRFEKSMTLKGQGAAQLNIGKDDIENYLIPQPNNESKKVISLLSYIDKKISIEYSLLQKYREQKTFLLSNMFI